MLRLDALSLRALLVAVSLALSACGGAPAPVGEETAAAGPAPAPAAPASATPAAVSDPAGGGPSDPFGYYFLDSAEPLPAWAAAIDHLHLSTIEAREDEIVTVPLHGFFRPRSGDDYPLVQVRQAGARLSFATAEVDGVAFDFDGRFLQAGSFPEAPPQGRVLAGRLRRLQAGQVTGELDAGFTYSSGD